MTYTPTFNTKTLKRLRQAYGYTINVFSTTEPIPKSNQALALRYGQLQHNLGKWIKQQLLICTDHHYSNASHISKKYILNETGAKYVKSILDGNRDKVFSTKEQLELQQGELKEPETFFDQYVVTKVVEEEHQIELNLKEFTYKDKSSRLWHPIQNLKRAAKKELLNKYGLKYHYDIRCCAPSLLLQHAKQYGLDKELPALTEYLSNRQYHRDRLTVDLELNSENGFIEKTSKILINALFCGARLGNSEQFALSKLMQHDKTRIEWLKQDEWLTDLRSDIKSCWSTIIEYMPRTKYFDKNGTSKNKPINSKQKWAVYFSLERQVLNAASDYFRKTNNKCFLEHDGWSTEMMIDLQDMKHYIFKKTGFNIEIDCEYHLESDSIDTDVSWTPASQCTLVNSLTLTDACVFTSSSTPTATDNHNEYYTTLSTAQTPMYITEVLTTSNTEISPTAKDNLTWLQRYLRSRK